MIVSKNHLKRFLKKDFDDEELSSALFQLGHENEIVKDEELRKFLEDVFLDYMMNNSIPSLD